MVRYAVGKGDLEGKVLRIVGNATTLEGFEIEDPEEHPETVLAHRSISRVLRTYHEQMLKRVGKQIEKALDGQLP